MDMDKDEAPYIAAEDLAEVRVIYQRVPERGITAKELSQSLGRDITHRLPRLVKKGILRIARGGTRCRYYRGEVDRVRVGSRGVVITYEDLHGDVS